MKTAEKYFNIYTGGNDHVATWTPKAIIEFGKDYAAYYHKQKLAEIIPSDKEIEIEAQKYWQHSTDILSIWFEKGANWFKSLLTKEE